MMWHKKFTIENIMGNYTETNIDLLLEQELDKLKGLVDKIQEINKNVLRNSSQVDAITQKYNDISLTISGIESKLVNPINSDDFVNRDTFQTQQEEIDSQFLLINQAQKSLNKQLIEFDSLVQGLTPNIENSFNEKINQLVSIESFKKEITDIQKIIEKTSTNFVEKYEIEDVKKSLGLVLKDIGEIYRLAGEIDKEKISKLEAKTSDNLRKIKDQINQYSVKIDIQSEALGAIRKQFTDLVSNTKLQELEKRLIDKTITLNREINDLKLENKELSEKISGQKGYNATFVILFLIFAFLIIIELIK